MSDKLLPCPFCGGKAVKNGRYAEIQYYGCGSENSWCPIHVIAASLGQWNRRFVCPDKNGDKVYAGDLIGRNGVVFGKILQMVPHDAEPWYYYEGDTGERGCETGPIELIKESDK